MLSHAQLPYVALAIICLMPPIPMTAQELAEPVPLIADGKTLDMTVWRHLGPCLEDFDRDGDLDLIVGTFAIVEEIGDELKWTDARFHHYENVGNAKEPRYESRGWLQSEGQIATVPIGCCIGSSPVFADMNGDGLRDLVSGCYTSRGVFMFPRTDDPANPLGPRVELLDEHGKSLLRLPEYPEHSKGTFPAPVDWDLDGDLDLVIGNLDGSIHLRLNVGTTTKPVFSSIGTPLQSAGREIMIGDGRNGHAAVSVADWDNDGRFDLIAGCIDGSVTWFRNIGKPGQPEFGEQQSLVPPGMRLYGSPYFSDEPPIKGGDAQICVVDYNQDGLLDLLVSDTHMSFPIRTDITPEQRTAIHANMEKRVKFWKEQSQRTDEIHQKIESEFPGKLYYTDPAQEKLNKIFTDYKATEDYQNRHKWISNLDEEMTPFLAIPAGPGLPLRQHSYIWLYLREPSTDKKATVQWSSNFKIDEPTIANPVSWNVMAESKKNESILTVKIIGKAKDGVHLGTTRVDDASGVPTTIRISMPVLFKLIEETNPDPKRTTTKLGFQNVYEGEFEFVRHYRYSGEPSPETIDGKVAITYQACNAFQCYQIETKRFDIRFKME